MNTPHLRTLSPDRPVRFAVVGCGNMGRRHCEFIRTLPQAELFAVYDRVPETAAAAAPKAKVFSSYEEMLSSPDVDSVVICLPSAMHAHFGIAAANAGKHLVVEKPIDASLQSARELVASSEAAGVLCAVISQNRFAPGIRFLKEAVTDAKLGKIIGARASVRWHREDKYYAESEWRGRVSGERGGVLMNQAIHSTDILLWLLGEPAELYAMTAHNRPGIMETEDTAVVCLRFTSGTLATLEASTSAAPGFDERYEIYGTKGAAFVEKGRIVYWSGEGDIPSDSGVTRMDLFGAQYQDIISAFRGTKPLLVRPEEALRVVEVTEACYRSAAEKRPIHFNSPPAEEER